MSDLVNRMSQLLIKHEYAINSLKQDSTVYFFVQPGPQGLLPILFNTSEKWNQVQHETPEQTEESLRLVLLKALLIELGQRLKNSQNNEEAMQAAQEMGWITAEGRWKTLVWNLQTAALEEVPNGPNGRHGLRRPSLPRQSSYANSSIRRRSSGKGLSKAPQASWVQLALELSVRGKGLAPGKSSSHGSVALPFMRWAAVSAGEGRPVATGPLSAMVGSLGPAGHAAPGGRSATQVPPSFNLENWRLADGPQSLSSVLQSLLWPMWMDPDRQCYAPGLIKHLWRRAAQAPNTALHLRGDLFWMPMAAKWQFVQAVHPMILLPSLLSAFSDSLDTGEWGMHLQTFDLAFEGLTLLACHADTAMRTGNTVITAGACGCLGTLHRKAQIAWLC